METEGEVKATLTSEDGFYVGDICHQMTEADYDGIWQLPNFNEFGGAYEMRGHKFAFAETAYGDGYYLDAHGKGYGVDSGTIGILPLALCKDKARTDDILGKFVNAKKAWFESKDGAFHIRFDTGEEININTDDEEDKDKA